MGSCAVSCSAQDWAKAMLAKSPRHGEFVTVPEASGRKLQVWVVYPQVKAKAPVVVMIHEIFGLERLGAGDGRRAGGRWVYCGRAGFAERAGTDGCARLRRQPARRWIMITWDRVGQARRTWPRSLAGRVRFLIAMPWCGRCLPCPMRRCSRTWML